MSELTCSCGKRITAEERYTFGGEAKCQDCYLGPDERGPLADQYQACAKCGHLQHRFTVVCESCRSPVREIGKVESAAKGSATKGIVFVVGIVVFALAAMALGDRGYEQAGWSPVEAIALGVSGFLLGVNGLLGLLYFRFFAVVTFLRGLPGFGLGALSLIGGAVCYILLI